MTNNETSFEDLWPELFEVLTDRQRDTVVRSLAAGWHEGWVPNREDVADLADFARGAIDMDEYRRRSLEKAERITELVQASAERIEQEVKAGVRTKLSYYPTLKESERIRAAFIAGRNAGKPWRSFSDFQRETMLAKVAQLETELNGGLPFEGVPVNILSPGRPLDT